MLLLIFICSVMVPPNCLLFKTARMLSKDFFQKCTKEKKMDFGRRICMSTRRMTYSCRSYTKSALYRERVVVTGLGRPYTHPSPPRRLITFSTMFSLVFFFYFWVFRSFFCIDPDPTPFYGRKVSHRIYCIDEIAK